VFFSPESLYKNQKITTLPTASVMYLRFLLDGYNSFSFSGKLIDAPSLLFGVLQNVSSPNPTIKKFENIMSHFEYLEAKLLSGLPEININEANVMASGTLQIVHLFNLTSSEAVNDQVVQPLVKQWREVEA